MSNGIALCLVDIGILVTMTMFVPVEKGELLKLDHSVDDDVSFLNVFQLYLF